MQKSTKTEQEDRGTRVALTEVMRAGARTLIAQALEAEVGELLATYFDQQDVCYSPLSRPKTSIIKIEFHVLFLSPMIC